MGKASLQYGFAGLSFLIFTLCIVAIAGGVYYLWTESDHNPIAQTAQVQSPQSVQATIAAAPTTGEFRSTMSRLIGRGDTLECDWRMENADPEVNGMLWTMGNQGRSVAKSAHVEADAIYKDDMVYAWQNTNGTKSGFTLNESQIDSLSSRLSTEQKEQLTQMQNDMIFNCRAWNPQAEKFTPPSDITFSKL